MQGKGSLNKRLEQIKKEFGYSNEEMGQICGISATAFGNIINGSTKDPSVSIIFSISKKLSININWILEGEGNMKEPTNNSPTEIKDHPESVKFLTQENENLKMMINMQKEQIDTLKRMLTFFEHHLNLDKKQA